MKKFLIIIILFLGLTVLNGCEKEEEIPVDEDIYYTVTFVDYNNEVILEVEVLEFTTVTPPTAPVRDGYIFKGWSKGLDNVSSDMTVEATYEEILPNYYIVKFFSFGSLVKEEQVEEGKAATAPSAEVAGYIFNGWDKDFSKVMGNLEVNGIYEKIIIPYVSYEEDFTFPTLLDYSYLIAGIESENPRYTFNNIKNGGSRGENEMVYYDNPAVFNTNQWGFEIAVDSNNVIIARATKVVMPEGGFVISGHGTASDLLEKNTKLGDIIIYSSNVAKLYRKAEITNIINLAIEIDILKAKVIEANNNYEALDYKQITLDLVQVSNIYNSLFSGYNKASYDIASQMVLDTYFKLVEATSATVRAMWHYPLRAGSYTETNENQVKVFLDRLNEVGINRVYLNTNFNGKSIYKSEYLTTSLTNYYTYGSYKDYLECFIEEAHLRGIEVYAWTNTLIAGDGSNNPYYSSRGWLLKGYNGQDNSGGMYFVDISNPEVQDFLGNVFSELSGEYNLDGIEFDFIRYPNGNLHTFSGVIDDTTKITDWGYTETFINGFMSKYNLTGDFKELIKNNNTVRTNFIAYKMQVLTDTVIMLNNKIKTANSNVKISAAVMPSINTAKTTYLQDWETWIKNGLVEELEPMIYTAHNSRVVTDISSMKNVVKDYATIVAGIFPEGDGADLSMNAEQIILLQRLAVHGMSKFSSRQMFASTSFVEAFKKMKRDYTVLPTSSKEEILEAYFIDLGFKLNNYYIYRDTNSNYTNLITLLSSNANLETRFDLVEGLIKSLENSNVKDKLIFEYEKIKSFIK